jgi:hypothetical protein
MEDGSLDVHVPARTTGPSPAPAVNIATRCIIVPAPCCMVVNTSLYTEREAWRLHTHTRERRELGCATPTVSRDVHGSRAAHWGARCCSHLCTIRCRTHKHTARQWDMHCSSRHNSFPTSAAAASCCNVYDARRSTYDGAGADATRIIHARYAWLAAVGGRVS